MKNNEIKISREDFLHNPEVIAKLREIKEILNELKQINKINSISGCK